MPGGSVGSGGGDSPRRPAAWSPSKVRAKRAVVALKPEGLGFRGNPARKAYAPDNAHERTQEEDETITAHSEKNPRPGYL